MADLTPDQIQAAEEIQNLIALRRRTGKKFSPAMEAKLAEAEKQGLLFVPKRKAAPAPLQGDPTLRKPIQGSPMKRGAYPIMGSTSTGVFEEEYKPLERSDNAKNKSVLGFLGNVWGDLPRTIGESAAGMLAIPSALVGAPVNALQSALVARKALENYKKTRDPAFIDEFYENTDKSKASLRVPGEMATDLLGMGKEGVFTKIRTAAAMRDWSENKELPASVRLEAKRNAERLESEVWQGVKDQTYERPILQGLNATMGVGTPGKTAALMKVSQASKNVARIEALLNASKDSPQLRSKYGAELTAAKAGLTKAKYQSNRITSIENDVNSFGIPKIVGAVDSALSKKPSYVSAKARATAALNKPIGAGALNKARANVAKAEMDMEFQDMADAPWQLQQRYRAVTEGIQQDIQALSRRAKLKEQAVPDVLPEPATPPIEPTNLPIEATNPPEVLPPAKAVEVPPVETTPPTAATLPDSPPVRIEGGGAIAPEAVPPVEVLPVEPPVGKPIGFKTSKGSTYELHEDGTTTRNKSYHPEHGPKDQGFMPRSSATYYLPFDEVVSKLSLVQAKGSYKTSIGRLPGGSIAVRYIEGPDAGKFIKDTIATPKMQPEVGLIPVEVWDDGGFVHFGNEIVSIDSPAPSPKALPVEPPVGGLAEVKKRTRKPKAAAEVTPAEDPRLTELRGIYAGQETGMLQRARDGFADNPGAVPLVAIIEAELAKRGVPLENPVATAVPDAPVPAAIAEAPPAPAPVRPPIVEASLQALPEATPYYMGNAEGNLPDATATFEVVHSGSTDPRLAKIMADWGKDLGIKGKLYIDVAEDLLLEKDGEYHVSPDPGSSGLIRLSSRFNEAAADTTPSAYRDSTVMESLATASHELGHHYLEQTWLDADPAVKKSVVEAYAGFAKKTGGYKAGDKFKAMTPEQIQALAESKTFGGKDVFTGEQLGDTTQKEVGYQRSFSEWFANQVSKWALSNERPLSAVDSFFKSIADKLKSFFNKNKESLPHKSVTEYIQAVSSKVNAPPPKVSAFTKDRISSLDAGIPRRYSASIPSRDAIAAVTESVNTSPEPAPAPPVTPSLDELAARVLYRNPGSVEKMGKDYAPDISLGAYAKDAPAGQKVPLRIAQEMGLTPEQASALEAKVLSLMVEAAKASGKRTARPADIKAWVGEKYPAVMDATTSADAPSSNPAVNPAMGGLAAIIPIDFSNPLIGGVMTAGGIAAVGLLYAAGQHLKGGLAKLKGKLETDSSAAVKLDTYLSDYVEAILPREAEARLSPTILDDGSLEPIAPATSQEIAEARANIVRMVEQDLELRPEKGVPADQAASVAEEFMQMGDRIAQTFEALGQELVDVGLINEEAYAANKGRYLRRIYQMWEDPEGYLGELEKRLTSEGASKEMVGVALSRERQLFKSMTGRSADGVQMTGTSPSGRTSKAKLAARKLNEKDMELRDFLGEIGLSSIRSRRGGEIASREISKAVLSQSVADKFSVTSKRAMEIDKMPDARKKGTAPPDDSVFRNPAERLYYYHRELFEQVQQEDNLKGLGHLEGDTFYGSHIPATILKELTQGEYQPTTAFQKYMMAWKLSKTAMNPSSWAGNVFGNVMLSYLGGGMRALNPENLVRAIKSIRERDSYFETAMEHSDHPFESLRMEITTREHLDPKIIYPGTLKNRLKQAAKKGKDNITNLYGGIDTVFKHALFVDTMDRLADIDPSMTPDQRAQIAAQQVAKTFPNFRHGTPIRLLRPAVKTLRRSQISPFVSWDASIIPLATMLLMEHPTRAALFPSMYQAYQKSIESWMESQPGGKEAYEEEKRALPDYMDSYIRLPMDREKSPSTGEENGAALYGDSKPFNPLTALYDVTENPLEAVMMRLGPIIQTIQAIHSNRKLGTDIPVYQEGDPFIDQFKDGAAYAAKQTIPYATQLMQLKANLTGRSETPREVDMGNGESKFTYDLDTGDRIRQAARLARVGVKRVDIPKEMRGRAFGIQDSYKDYRKAGKAAQRAAEALRGRQLTEEEAENVVAPSQKILQRKARKVRGGE